MLCQLKTMILILKITMHEADFMRGVLSFKRVLEDKGNNFLENGAVESVKTAFLTGQHVSPE